MTQIPIIESILDEVYFLSESILARLIISNACLTAPSQFCSEPLLLIDISKLDKIDNKF